MILEKNIEAELLSLSASDRAYLAEKLLSSLDNNDQETFDEVWATECEDRIKAYDDGLIKSSNASDVFSRIEARFFK